MKLRRRGDGDRGNGPADRGLGYLRLAGDRRVGLRAEELFFFTNLADFAFPGAFLALETAGDFRLALDALATFLPEPRLCGDALRTALALDLATAAFFDGRATPASKGR